MADMRAGLPPREGYVMKKHGAESVMEGLSAELEAVRKREDLGDNDAAQRYEFIIESLVSLAGALKDNNDALTKRIQKLEDDTAMIGRRYS